MVNIAVPGGAGNVGKTIVEVLKENPKHNVIILSRKAVDNALAPVKVVNYDDVDALKALLEEHQIHTVISTLSHVSPDAARGELNLIKAADAASPTKRFIASDWGVPVPKDSPLPHLASRAQAVASLKKTGLEWTRVVNGYFLDYYSSPHVKTHMPYLPFVLDIPNKVAAIPGTGNDPVVLTYTFDVARFVAAALDLPAGQWSELFTVIGDKLTFNEFLKLAEEARGAKFEVHYDPVEKLQTFQVTELPGHRDGYAAFPKEQLQAFFATFESWIVQGLFDLPYAGTLNETFPEIKTLKAKDILEQAWKGK